MKKLSCREIADTISGGLDRKLPLRRRLGLRLRLLLCAFTCEGRPCVNLERHLKLLRCAVKKLSGPEAVAPGYGESLRPDARKRIRRALEREVS